ncbi:MAG: helix-turn-helix transcriptional regulator [Clostridia bacterium]|nr:helix-turn-helix transcriptional regulator [Clostridia bacterium]
MKLQTYYNTPLEKDANICNTEIRLSVNCAGAVDESRDVSTRAVRRDFYLIYIIGGQMNMELGESCFVMNAGHLLIIRPETPFFYYTVGDLRVNYIWIHFTGGETEKLLDCLRLPTNTLLDAGVHKGAEEYWQRMFREFVINDEFFDLSASSLLVEILTFFSRNIHRVQGRRELFKSISYIHENYQKNIKVSELAKLENMSEAHYRVCFRRMTGFSPNEYLSDRRINAAAELLENTNKKIEEISALAGYNDVYYFGRVFKKKTGISPGRYRKNALMSK